MSCDFVVGARIVGSDGITVRIELEDEAAGYVLLNEIGAPEWVEASGRATSPYMHGDAPTGLATIEVGFLPVTVEVSGSTWPIAQARVDALEIAWRADPGAFFFEHETAGVTRRYRAERSAWRPEPITAEIIARAKQEVALVFRVQPLPSTVYA